jgi:hypothetical protein
MSTKSDLQKQVKNLKNQVAQLKRTRTTRVKPSSQGKRANRAPVADVPTISGTSRPLRIQETERIGTITANSNAGSFKADGFTINPANTTTFPWLSSIAKLYDKYKFHKLRFSYINNAPTSVAGNVSLAVDFDTLDTSPATSIAMSNLAKFKTFAPWKSETLEIPVNRRGNNLWLFTEDTQAQSDTKVDLKTYNLGKFYVSTEGMSASQVAGYLVVEYDVELLDKNPN